MALHEINDLLSGQTAYYPKHKSATIDKSLLTFPFYGGLPATVASKHAGGMGLIFGRTAFQRPFEEGVALLNATQDVYLDKDITIA